MSAALKIPMEDYVADNVGAPQPSLSSGVAHRLLSRSPLHAWTRHPRLNPAYEQETSDAFDLGTAVHAVLLEGREDLLAPAPFSDWRTKEAKVFKEQARANGQIPLLVSQVGDVINMSGIAKRALAECPDLEGCAPYDPEQTFVFEHDGAWLRCRPDLTARNLSVIISFKTTSASADPESYARTLLNMGYDMQAAFEKTGARRIFGRDPRYVWMVQEVQPPFAVSFVGMTPELEAYASERMDLAVRKWRACLDSDDWPAYSKRICYADLPPWITSAWEERKLMEQMGEPF